MPTVRELTALYENVMLAPIRGPGTCATCLTFTEGFTRCYVCGRCPPWLDAVAPISYSVAQEQLHHALATYKRLTGTVAERLQLQLTAILWRYLERHEACVASRSNTARFDLVTTVPSGRPDSQRHPLERMVGHICAPTRDRYQRLLARSSAQFGNHDFDPQKFYSLTNLHNEAVLLIDDTWTTGSNAQSAAATLKRAGAGAVAVVVIGRHLKRDWRANNERLGALSRPFDWETCVHCRPTPSLASRHQCRQ